MPPETRPIRLVSYAFPKRNFQPRPFHPPFLLCRTSLKSAPSGSPESLVNESVFDCTLFCPPKTSTAQHRVNQSWRMRAPAREASQSTAYHHQHYQAETTHCWRDTRGRPRCNWPFGPRKRLVDFGCFLTSSGRRPTITTAARTITRKQANLVRSERAMATCSSGYTVRSALCACPRHAHPKDTAEAGAKPACHYTHHCSYFQASRSTNTDTLILRPPRTSWPTALHVYIITMPINTNSRPNLIASPAETPFACTSCIVPRSSPALAICQTTGLGRLS